MLISQRPREYPQIEDSPAPVKDDANLNFMYFSDSIDDDNGDHEFPFSRQGLCRAIRSRLFVDHFRNPSGFRMVRGWPPSDRADGLRAFERGGATAGSDRSSRLIRRFSPGFRRSQESDESESVIQEWTVGRAAFWPDLVGNVNPLSIGPTGTISRARR